MLVAIRRNQLWRAIHSGLLIRISRPGPARGEWIVQRRVGLVPISERVLREFYERAR